MKQYILKFTKSEEVIGVFEDKSESVDKMMDAIERNNYGLFKDDNNYITPFDFTLEEVDTAPEDVNVIISDVYKASEYLNCDFRSNITLNKNNEKAIRALRDLVIIAEAWNKADGFVPDYSNSDQLKYYPWFKYDRHTTCFVSANAYNATTHAAAYYGSRLCFKSYERAVQFGKQFIDLWNDFLLFR